MSIKTILLAAFSLALLGAAPAWGCMCRGPQMCRASAAPVLSPDSIVFVGTVTAIGAPASTRPGKGLGRSESAVEFRVTEMLSGGKETTITGFNPVNTSCAVEFEVGRSYLIHARTGDMTVGTCDVLEAGAAQTLLLQLRAERDKLIGPDLLGMVTLPLPFQPMYASDLDALMATAQPAVDVAVVARSGSSEYRTRTGRDGRYEFRGLPSAEYQLTVMPPEGATAPYKDTLRLTFGAGMSCGLDFPLRHDTLMSITVVNAKGVPLAGTLSAIRTDITQPDSRSEAAVASRLYQFSGLSPGRYRFEFFPVQGDRADLLKRFPDPPTVDLKYGEKLEKRMVIN